MEIINTHECNKMPKGSKIYAINNGSPGFYTDWYMEIGVERFKIERCPFCENNLIPYECLYFEYDGKKRFVEGNGLNALWDAGYLYEVPMILADREGNKIELIAFAVNCNDLFWWACADYEILTYDEIQSLYEHCFDEKGKEKPYGSTIWACLKRGMRPQHPIEDKMKERGEWPPELEALPVRGDTG